MASAINGELFDWLTSTNFTPQALQDLNLTSQDDSVLYYLESTLKKLSTEQRTTFTVFVIIILVLSIFGNILTIITNFRREQRHLFRVCLLSLAFSDILFVVMTSVIYLSQFNNEHNALWTLGELFCSFAPFFQTLAVLVNSVTLVAIALDRYMAVVRLNKGTYEPSGLFCATCAILIWGLSAGVSSPMLTLYQIYDIIVLITDSSDPEMIIGTFMAQICATNKSKNGYYFGIIFTVIFLPLVISFVWLNAIIAKEIWVRRHPVDSHRKSDKAKKITTTTGSSSDRKTNTTSDGSTNPIPTLSQGVLSTTKCTCSNCMDLYTTPKCQAPPPPVPTKMLPTINAISSPATNSRKQRQLRMFKAIVFIMTVFLVCRLPNWIYLLIKMHGIAVTNLYWILHYSFGIMAMLNCVLNPLIYTFLSETIKMTVFLKALCTRCCVTSREQNSADQPSNQQIVKQKRKKYAR
ncbi:alpha-2A adrenergic receptor [Sabethes cyaneus]|uniref:alpha-2A adrenergic receptor n=1 Tax=Sabethes cyaneus TaxID=53552 RepID=UPI00237DD63C|nr:alpha-2A adrenergic receptor [Sabethes cyaneus]